MRISEIISIKSVLVLILIIILFTFLENNIKGLEAVEKNYLSDYYTVSNKYNDISLPYLTVVAEYYSKNITKEQLCLKQESPAQKPF